MIDQQECQGIAKLARSLKLYQTQNVITIWSSVFGLTIANWILMQLKVSMLQLELKVKYWWWCTDESLLYCQCSCYFQFNTIKSLIVNYLTWVMCSPYRSPAPRGAQPGPRGEPPGPGGGRWRLLRVSHQGSPLGLQSHLEAQCKTVFLYPKNSIYNLSIQRNAHYHQPPRLL